MSRATVGVYLAYSQEAIRLVLFIDETGRPFYFLSKKLARAELNYLILHKVVPARVHSTWQLQHYFLGEINQSLYRIPHQESSLNKSRVRLAGRME